GAANRQKLTWTLRNWPTLLPETFYSCFLPVAVDSRLVSSLRLKDQPVTERPRERLRANGPDSLSPGELVGILLRTGLKGANVVEIGKQLVQRHGSLHSLARASWKELAKEEGIGPDKAVTLVAAFALARRLVGETHGESPLLDTPEAVADLLREDSRL